MVSVGVPENTFDVTNDVMSANRDAVTHRDVTHDVTAVSNDARGKAINDVMR